MFCILNVGTSSFASTSETHCADPDISQLTVVVWSIGFLADKCCHFSVKLSPQPFLIQLTTLRKVKLIGIELIASTLEINSDK